MLSAIWVVLAIIATFRGARWKPWIAVGLGLGTVFLVGLGSGLAGYSAYEVGDFLTLFGIVVESILIIITGFYAVKPRPSSF